MASRTFTVREILDMAVDELKKALVDLDPSVDTKGMTKATMQELLMERCVEKPTTELISADTGVPAFVLKLPPELQLQWWMKQEEKATSFADKEAAFQRERELKELALEKAKIEAQMKADELDKQRTAAALEAQMRAEELDKQRIAAAEAKAQEIELKKLEIEHARLNQQPPAQPFPVFRLDQAIKLLPRFNEKCVEEYLVSFEKVAEINSWPKEQYASILQAVLVGKGLRVFSELSLTDCKDYATLKAALLRAYSVVSEVHRQRFRRHLKQNSETYADFAFMLNVHFKRWMEGEDAYENLERTREVIKIEQFMERLPSDLHTWLIDRAPKTLADAAKLSDEYTAIRKAQFKDNKGPFPKKPFKTDSTDSPTPKDGSSVAGTGTVNETALSRGRETAVETPISTPGKGLFCNYCHRKGHTCVPAPSAINDSVLKRVVRDQMRNQFSPSHHRHSRINLISYRILTHVSIHTGVKPF